jgi:hypothetical protein
MRLHNALDVVNFLQDHFNQAYASYSNAHKNIQLFFYEVKSIDVN